MLVPFLTPLAPRERAQPAMARPVATHLPLALQSPPDTEDEEMDITAEMLCASADRWRVTLRELELPTLLWVAL